MAYKRPKRIMDTLLIIIGIVFGILQIILFFKIWGMTDDVKSIKKKLRSEEINEVDLARVVLKRHMMAKDDEAESIITDNLLTTIFEVCDEPETSLQFKDNKVKEVQQRAEKLYALIDRPVPSSIADVNVSKLVGVLKQF